MKQRYAKIAINVLIVVLVGLVLILVAPRIFGIKLYSVLSGSMEPAYSVGDLIYVFPTDTNKLEVGDVVSFVMNSQGTIATHRIISIDSGSGTVLTKGDANETTDGKSVSMENIIGVVKFRIPKLGYIVGYMSSSAGRIISITVILAMILLIMLLQRTADAEDPNAPPPEPQTSASFMDTVKEKFIGIKNALPGMHPPAEEEPVPVDTQMVSALQPELPDAPQEDAATLRARAMREQQALIAQQEQIAQQEAARQAAALNAQQEAAARQAHARAQQFAKAQAAQAAKLQTAHEKGTAIVPIVPQQHLRETLLAGGYYSTANRYHVRNAAQWAQLRNVENRAQILKRTLAMQQQKA